MADETTTTTADSQTTVVDPSQKGGEQTEKTDTVVTDTPKKEETTTTVEEEVENIQTNQITKDEDGNFVLPLDPENPEGTVYKGSTLDELFLNVRKGILEKDTTITRMKAQGFKPTAGKDARVNGNAPSTSEVEPPDDNAIFTAVIKDFAIDPKVLNWTKEEWRTYEQENGAVETMELRQKVNQAKAVSSQRIAEENVLYVNNSNLEQEVSLAVETLVENNLSPDDIDLDAVIERTKTNPRYWHENGVRVPGAILDELRKEIIKKVVKQTEKTTQKKIALGVTQAPKTEKKTTVSADPKKTETKDKADVRNTSDARDQILKEMRAKGAL